jgi:alkanesulfonate monooxygenase SsuD/methylene tetrahydromethanopterin reductase-like flavin-dependent oxidoreductase (luciferase family)
VEVIRELEQFRDLGVTHFMFRMPDLATVKHFVEAVVPQFG